MCLDYEWRAVWCENITYSSEGGSYCKVTRPTLLFFMVMPGMVGGFGNTHINFIHFKTENLRIILNIFHIVKNKLKTKRIKNINYYSTNTNIEKLYNESNLCSYLAGLIEGDGSFAVHDLNSNSKKYSPKIIIVFKKADLPLANYLKSLTISGKILNKESKGYILWQIQDIVSIFRIVNLINGYMRTPKIKALWKIIEWLNNYIIVNQHSKLSKKKKY